MADDLLKDSKQKDGHIFFLECRGFVADNHRQVSYLLQWALIFLECRGKVVEARVSETPTAAGKGSASSAESLPHLQKAPRVYLDGWLY